MPRNLANDRLSSGNEIFERIERDALVAIEDLRVLAPHDICLYVLNEALAVPHEQLDFSWLESVTSVLGIVQRIKEAAVAN